MKNALVATLLILFVSLVSCQNESETETKEQSPVLPAATNTNTTPVSAPVKNETINNNAPTLPVLNNNPSVTLNPEHGKPGHRCDIAVGAPLNTAPANKTATPVITSSPATTVDVKPTVTPVNTAPVTATAPGMNPQHGQPGHRCDIAVGAPLNSAPVNKTATPVIASTPATTVDVKPTVTPVNTAPVTATAPGMNPQHGQPGHRCDIAVGAPLNSKPKQ